MSRWIAAAFVAACACGLAFGQVRGPDTEARKTVNGFGATILLTKKPEQFVRNWANSSPEQKLSIHTAGDARTGEYVAALVFFWGCRSIRDACGVYVDYQLVAPDGSIRYNVADQTGTMQPKPKSDLVYLSEAIVRFQFEPKDPPGQYTIRATVREPATGNIVRISEGIRFVN
jgi:hypothetical protein